LILFVILLVSRSRHFPPGSPPMGWNSWTAFGTDINEQLIKDTVAALIAKGLDQYEYVIVDDGWMSSERDANGNLQADSEKFPSGMKALGDYIHSKGFKFGLYTSIGRTTCEGLPGSYDHEVQDAKQFIEWGVDYLKIDWCTGRHKWSPFWDYKAGYAKMSRELRKHDIIIAICNWGFGDSIRWGMADTVRITFDVHPNEFMIDYIIIRGRITPQLSAWNDLDSLEIGNGISDELAEKQMYWWCVLRSPLIIGSDVRNLSGRDIEILTDKKLIALNQT